MADYAGQLLDTTHVAAREPGRAQLPPQGATRRLHYRVGDGASPTRGSVTSAADLPVGAVVEGVTTS